MKNGDLPAYTGLTKREYFASMAMQGMLAASGNNSYLERGGDFNMPHITTQAIEIADLILKQLES